MENSPFSPEQRRCIIRMAARRGMTFEEVQNELYREIQTLRHAGAVGDVQTPALHTVSLRCPPIQDERPPVDWWGGTAFHDPDNLPR